MEAELKGMMGEWIQEGATALRQNPLATVAEWLGFSREDNVSDIKSALSDVKNAKGPLDKFVAKFSLMIALFVGKILGVDFTKSLTPEEVKLAGIRPKGDKAAENKDQPRTEVEKFLSEKSYDMTSKILIYGVSREKFDTALWAAVKGVTDATWWKDDVEKKESTLSETITTLGLAKVKGKSWEQLQTMGEAGLLAFLGQSEPRNKAAVSLIFSMLRAQGERMKNVFSPENWESIPLEKVMATLYKKEWLERVENLTDKIKGIDISKGITIPDLFTQISKDASGMPRFGGVVGQELEALKGQWVSPAFLGSLLEINRGTQTLDAFRANMKNEKFTPSEVAFLEKIMNEEAYLSSLRRGLAEKFGFTDKLISHLSQSNLALRDLLEIYAITWGNADITKIDKWRRAVLFTKLQMIFGTKDTNELWQYLGKIANDAGKKYPEAWDVAVMIDSTLNYGAYKAAFKAVEWGEKMLDAVLGYLWISPSRTIKGSAVIGGTGGILWLAFQLTPIWRAVAMIPLILSALGITGFTIAQASTKK
jgi:hypothetical protein